MFVKKIKISNFRLYKNLFEIDEFNIPNGEQGSGLTLIVGENGCGKTSILDAISLCTLEYKASSFNISDFNSLKLNTEIELELNEQIEVKKTMSGTFFAKGFIFKSNIRKQSSSTYLQSPVVYDQLYVGVDLKNPKLGSPDLRISVNNPFSGKRFDEIEVLYLDKNRLFQTKSGNFNDTKFDRLMKDFNSQYIKKYKEDKIPDINNSIKNQLKDSVKNIYLNDAIKKFNELSKLNIRLDFINNYEPFNSASFVLKDSNDIQIPLSAIGTGYEMIFSLLYSYYLAKQNNKKIIFLIDEPELHLHPRIQKNFVEFLLEISKECQIILTSHSPVLVKQLLYNSNIKSIIVNKNKTKSEIKDFKLSYLSSNEINYLAFDLATEEYHNELYEEINNKYYPLERRIKELDTRYFINDKKEKKNYPWKGNPNEVSIHTYIRNQIHHRKENGNPNYVDLKKSIDYMRSCL